MSGDYDALGGIRVVDASFGRAGPLAAMFLADFGADVVKIEPPGGDPARGTPGFPIWNRGKQSVVLDALTSRGLHTFDALVRGAHIVVTSSESFVRPERVRETNPAAVVLHTPPTLRPAPWAGIHESDPLVSAWMGVPLRQSSFDGGPVDHVYPIVTSLQGIWAAACAVSALIERERSGEGQIVTVSGEHGAMIASAGALTVRESELNAAPSRGGGSGGRIAFYRTYACGDGEWLFFAALIPRFTQIGFEVLGLEHLFDDPRLGGRGRAAMITPEHSGWVTDTVAERFLTRPRDEWLARLRAAGCPSGAVLDRDGWLDQVGDIGMRAVVEDPELGTVEMPGVPVRLGHTPGAIRSAAPKIGSSFVPDWTVRAQPVASDRRADGPLDGVRVLDLGAIIAGPFAASLLGDLGADVVKVEPLTGDSFRGPGFAAYNKGQRGIALDLRHADGRTAFLDLVRTADVVVDNYRPRVLERLAIDWAALQQVSPRVISASITAFGEGGPHRDDAGFDPVLQAMSGMMRGQGGDGDPVFFTIPVNDVAGAAMLAFGSVLALYHRERTGVAQKVTTSLAAASVIMQAEALVRFEGRPPPRRGSRDHLGPLPLERFYRTTDGWIRIEASGPDALRALAATGVTIEDGDVEGAMTRWSASLSRDEALACLSATGIPAAGARTVAEIVRDPGSQADGLVHADPRPDREGWTSGRHAHFSRTMRTDTLVSPALGEHTRTVLSELGYGASQIDDLVTSGAALEAKAPRS